MDGKSLRLPPALQQPSGSPYGLTERRLSAWREDNDRNIAVGSLLINIVIGIHLDESPPETVFLCGAGLPRYHLRLLACNLYRHLWIVGKVQIPEGMMWHTAL